MKVMIDDLNSASARAIADLMIIYESDTYMNVKGYLQKLVDLLFSLGYYDYNESLFPKGL